MNRNQQPISRQPTDQNKRPSAGSSSEGSSNDMSDVNAYPSRRIHRSSSLSEHQPCDDPSRESLNTLNFPQKLHEILKTPEFNDMICWLPHGRAWRVQQQDKLESEVLPKFFKHKKYTSFARQVYGWGFNRIPSGPDYNAFYHEFFLRDDPELSLKMKRPSKTELAEQRKLVADSPPNFYAMPPVSTSAPGDAINHDTSMTQDKYQNELVRLLSSFSSLQEKGLYLQMELDRLDKNRAQVLQQLHLLKGEDGTRIDQRIPESSVNISGQLPLQFSTILQPQQQLTDPRNLNNAFISSLNPWVQRAAQELYLEQQMQLRSTGYGVGGSNSSANSNVNDRM